jgi:hypothetical protein
MGLSRRDAVTLVSMGMAQRLPSRNRRPRRRNPPVPVECLHRRIRCPSTRSHHLKSRPSLGRASRGTWILSPITGRRVTVAVGDLRAVKH